MDAAIRPQTVLELNADLTVGDGLQEMVAGALAALKARGRGGGDPNANAVHRFRVGLRRLRSILSVFDDALPDCERRALGDRLRAIGQRYGRTREWDVFLANTVAPLQAIANHETLSVLERLARSARRASVPPGDTLRAHVADIEAAVAGAPWLRHPASAQAELWDLPLREHAAKLLSKRHRKLKKGVKDADLVHQAAFHQLRIRVKKLRYASEFLKSLFDNDRADKYLDRLVGLQDLMGRLNDARIGTVLMEELSLPGPARHLLTGWLACEIASCRERFPGRARAFRRAAPFWE
jgi:triphosphatase